MYSSAGCPCPSIRFSATYVIRRPAKISQVITMYTLHKSIIIQLLSLQNYAFNVLVMI